jgi:hypothetical protein
MLALSVGTCLTMVVFWTVQEAYGGRSYSFHESDLWILPGVALMILFEFGVTGYLVTTLISRFALRGKWQWLYPGVSAVLYLIHSAIFFVGSGNSIFRRDDLMIQFGGACVAFLCGWFGNRLLNRWSTERSGPSRALVVEL